MSSLWHKIKGLGKKAVKTVKNTFTDPTSAFKEFTGSSILAGIGIPSVSGVGSSLVDMAKGVNWQRELYRTLEGYIPGTNINPIDRYLGKDIARMNFDQQQQAYEYQKWLNEQQMQREDEAYQRKLKDVTAAGFNPILAAGGSGSPSSPLHAGAAPQMADTSGALREGIGQVLGIMSGFANLRKVKAETSFLNSQRDNVIADTVKKEEEAQNLRILNRYEDEYLAGRNQGQKIANEMHSFGLSVSKMELPYKIQDWQKSLSLKDKELALKDVEKTLKELNVSNLELDNIYKGLLNNKMFKELDKLDQDLQLGIISISMKQAELDEYLYAKGYFHERYGGTPVGYSLPSIHALPYNIIRNAVEEVDKHVPKPGAYPFVRNYASPGRSFNHNWITERWENYSSGDYGVRRNY